MDGLKIRLNNKRRIAEMVIVWVLGCRMWQWLRHRVGQSEAQSGSDLKPDKANKIKMLSIESISRIAWMKWKIKFSILIHESK